MLNSRQVCWTLKLAVYNFEIFYYSNKTNSTNRLSRQLDYEKVLLLNTRLL